MLADYVMKSIDNLFSEKLFQNETNTLTKNSFAFQKNRERKANLKFNKDVIKKSLSKIIRKQNQEDKSLSPISKSRLKVILEHNKDERIKSVVKKVTNNLPQKETSPYKKIEIDYSTRGKQKSIRLKQQKSKIATTKQNDIIGYYREQRKSIQKVQKSLSKNKRKMRIFGSNNEMTHNFSATDFHIQKL